MDELPPDEKESENESNEDSEVENDVTDDHEEVKENGEVSVEEGKGKKRKKNKTNKRKKIRKLLTQDKLAPETLSALQEEENRQKRLELLKQQNAENQPKLSDAEVIPETDFLLTANDFDDIADEIIVNHCGSLEPQQDVLTIPEENTQNFAHEATKLNGKISPGPVLINDSTDDVICISSDDDDDTQPVVVLNNTISTGSESDDDDVICTGDNLNAIADNGGIHVDDAQNVQDETGRILINVNRPQSEDPIYLSDKLTPYVKPHQIGGIRFMFDNIVETIGTFGSSNGLGCILAHAMGLGKTLQCVSFIDVFLRHTTAKTVLCIVPVNTLLNWINEFKYWLNIDCSNSFTPSSGDNVENKDDGPFKLYMLGEGQKTIASRTEVVAKWVETGGVMLMGYEMYRQLASKKIGRRKNKNHNCDDHYNKLCGLLNTTYANIVDPGPDLVICDEGHRIKNSHAGISKVLKLIKTQRRIVLTGYPLQNNLMEYWCMVDFVRPNFLGTKQEFSNMFERPIHNGQCLDSTPADVRLMRFRSHVLFTQLKGFVQRRSHEVLKENLPSKEEHVLLVRLSSWQKKLYNYFIRDQLQTSPAWYNLNPIKAFSICCKIWNHPDIIYFTAQEKTDANKFDTNKTEPNLHSDIFTADVDLDIPDSILPRTQKPKSTMEKENGLSYDWTLPLLEGYKPNILEMSGKLVLFVKLLTEAVSIGEKLLLFSQSLNTLNLIEKFLSNIKIPAQDCEESTSKCWAKHESYFRLDGNTSSAERERLIKLFNAPTNTDVKLFLLSTRAGCLGINLTGANRVVVFDASWNPCHDAQAVCRVYRYGQKKKCHIYRLVTDNTMEKKIYDRQISKQGMSDRVVDKLNPIQSITRADVSKLLFFSDEDPPLIDVSDMEEEYSDTVLKTLLKTCGGWLTKKPFLHESLFIDNKGQRLTTAEISAAQREYNIEKRSSTTFNNSRASYSDFYGTNANGLLRSKSMVSFNNKNMPLPTLRTPNPLNPEYIKHADTSRVSENLFDDRSLFELARAGISVNKHKATNDVPMPGISSSGQPYAMPQKILVKAGETMYIIKGQKGVYMGTPDGQIFARKSQKFQANPDQFQYEYNQESRLVHAVFNRVTKRRLLQKTMMNGISGFNNLNQSRLHSSQSYPTFSNLTSNNMVSNPSQQSPMLNQLLSAMPSGMSSSLPPSNSHSSVPISLLDDTMDASSLDSNSNGSYSMPPLVSSSSMPAQFANNTSGETLVSNTAPIDLSVLATSADAGVSSNPAPVGVGTASISTTQDLSGNGPSVETVVPLRIGIGGGTSSIWPNHKDPFSVDAPVIPSVESLTNSVHNSINFPASINSDGLQTLSSNSNQTNFTNSITPSNYDNLFSNNFMPPQAYGLPLPTLNPATFPHSNTIFNNSDSSQNLYTNGTTTPPPLSFENFISASLGSTTL